MLMNRTFFLACATVVTLGIAAASSTPAQARPCSKAGSDREECLIRSAIYTAVSQAEAAAARAQQQQRQQAAAARAQQQRQQAAAARAQQQQQQQQQQAPEKSCGLTKEYVNGAVKFRDTCTGEWAQRDNIESKKAGL